MASRPFAKNEIIVVTTAIRAGVPVKKNAEVMKVLTNGDLDVKFEDGTRKTYKPGKCAHKRGPKPKAVQGTAATAKTAAKATGKTGKATRKVADTSAKKTEDKPEPKFAHTMVMAAMGKATADDRAINFRRDPSEATRDAILAAAKAELDSLIKAHGSKGGKAKAKTANSKAKAETKPAKVIRKKAA